MKGCLVNLRVLLLVAALASSFVSVLHADTVELNTGERLEGDILSQTDTQLVLEHAFLGQLVIPVDRVTAVTEATADAVAQAEVEQAVEEEVEQAAAEEVAAAEEKEWDSQLELGLNAATGNTDKLDFHTAIRSVRETEEDRTKLEASYFTAQADGDKTQNEFKAGVLQDWYFNGSPWLLNADLTYEYDDFEAWDHRLSGHIGPGYKLIREEDLDVTLRSGLGALKEWGSDEEDVQFEAKAGAELTWRISEAQTFNASATIYPSLSDLGEFRTVATADYTVKLDHADGLSFKVGVEDEYESETSGDAEHNDLKVYAALLMDF